MADIFISYSQQDRRRVKPLVDALTAEGCEVWWDLEIRAGESFDELIENAGKGAVCRHCVVATLGGLRVGARRIGLGERSGKIRLHTNR